MADIAFYKTVKATKGKATTFQSFIGDVKSGRYMKVINALRSNEIEKKSLPAVTISGVFEPRKADAMKSFSGYACFDVDHVDPSATKQIIKNDPYLYAAFESCSGKGLAVILKFDSPENYGQLYNEAMAYFSDKYNIKCDHTKDICRLRFVSWDIDMILNKDAIAFNGYQSKKIIKPIRQKAPISVPVSNTREKVKSLIAQLSQSNIDITNDYADWLKIGFAIANEFGEAGREYFHQLSSICSEKYDQSKCDDKYNECMRSGSAVKIGSLFYAAEQFGVKPKIEPGPLSKHKTDYNNSHAIELKVESDISQIESSLKQTLPEKHKPYLVSFDDPIIDKPPLIGVKDGERVQPIFTIGNISMGKGKSKSRKSFGVTLFLSAFFFAQKNEGLFQNRLTVNLPEDPSKWGALYIDTEQAKADLQRCMHRVPKLCGFTPDNLFVYQLRKAPTINERLELSLEAIEMYKDKISLVVIDGLADLGNDINDRGEFLAIILKLMSLSEAHNLHIHFILHENKSGTDARGHIGTEATNKSETVLQYAKHSEMGKYTTIIKGEYTRGMGFDDFSFSIDEGLPIIDDIALVVERKSKKKVTPESFEPKQHMTVLKYKSKIELDVEYSASDIVLRIKTGWGAQGISLGRDKAREFLNFYVDDGMIVKTKPNNNPRQKYKFNGHNQIYNGWKYEDL